jgi:hypothetical protein
VLAPLRFRVHNPPAEQGAVLKPSSPSKPHPNRRPRSVAQSEAAEPEPNLTRQKRPRTQPEDSSFNLLSTPNTPHEEEDDGIPEAEDPPQQDGPSLCLSPPPLAYAPTPQVHMPEGQTTTVSRFVGGAKLVHARMLEYVGRVVFNSPDSLFSRLS